MRYVEDEREAGALLVECLIWSRLVVGSKREQDILEVLNFDAFP